jgi:hypothetical protein
MPYTDSCSWILLTPKSRDKISIRGRVVTSLMLKMSFDL